MAEKWLLLSEVRARAIAHEGDEAKASAALAKHLITGRLLPKVPDRVSGEVDGFAIEVDLSRDRLTWQAYSFDWQASTACGPAHGREKGRRTPYAGDVVMHSLQFKESEVGALWPVKVDKASGQVKGVKTAVQIAAYINGLPGGPWSAPNLKALAEDEFGKIVRARWTEALKLIPNNGDGAKRLARGQKAANFRQ